MIFTPIQAKLAVEIAALLAGEATAAGKVRLSHADIYYQAEYRQPSSGTRCSHPRITRSPTRSTPNDTGAALDTPHDSVVSLNGIWKGFGGLPVLKDVSIELRRGEVHVLLGENGAGKSTLVNVMIGAHAPDRGEVRLHARPVDDLTPFVARQLGINAVMQDFSLAAAMTVAENYFGAAKRTAARFCARARCEPRRTRPFNLSRRAIDVDTPVSDLSRPQQQLLEIIRALGGRPGALILDEPTATLSHDESEILFSTLDRLRRGGWAVLYITHRLNEVHRSADRITILRDGSVVAQYPAGQVSDERLIRDMLGRSLETFYPAVQSQAGDVALALVGVSDKNGRISDVTLNVRYGEIVGIGGLVGCGKGEIGSIVFGLDALKAGRSNWTDSRGVSADQGTRCSTGSSIRLRIVAAKRLHSTAVRMRT